MVIMPTSSIILRNKRMQTVSSTRFLMLESLLTWVLKKCIGPFLPYRSPESSGAVRHMFSRERETPTCWGMAETSWKRRIGAVVLNTARERHSYLCEGAHARWCSHTGWDFEWGREGCGVFGQGKRDEVGFGRNGLGSPPSRQESF